MSLFRTLHRSILVLFAVVTVSIVTLTHFSVSKIVAEQSRKQQQSYSPAFTLLVQQFLEPLHVSQALVKTREVRELMQADTLNEQEVFSTLDSLEHKFGYSFFLASDKTRRQYNSDGTQFPLVEGEVSWYFKYKDSNRAVVADIGKWEDTHIYIDLKVTDEKGNFTGFFGMGKSLKSFLDIFATYKETYGYDFIFVDESNTIMLSSIAELNAQNSRFNTLADLDWYQAIDQSTLTDGSLNNEIIKFGGNDALVASVEIGPFDWEVLLITPLKSRQTELSNTLILAVVSVLVVIFALFILIYNLLYVFRQDMTRNAQTDSLTQLPNRNKIELKYEELLDEGREVSIILVDIDHFKAVNDTHGFVAGNQIIKQIAQLFKHELREEDVVGRWGGEEFVVLLPDTGPEQAFDVAQKLRVTLANMTASTGTMSLQVTASFGVSHTDTHRPLKEIIANADDALYRAKRDGRNLVRIQLTNAA